jgi:hypothetical protein
MAQAEEPKAAEESPAVVLVSAELQKWALRDALLLTSSQAQSAFFHKDGHPWESSNQKEVNWEDNSTIFTMWGDNSLSSNEAFWMPQDD